MATNLRAVIGKLNSTTRNALEGAAGLCLSRTNYNVEIEHFLMKLLDVSGADFAFIAKHFGIDKSRLAAELNRSIDKLKSGSARNPAISESVLKMLKEGWTTGSLEFNDDAVRTGYCILALVSTPELGREINEASKEFQKINADALKKDFASIVAQSEEETQISTADAEAAAGGQKPKAGGKTPNLDQYTVNLTENAKKGKIDPVLGRDFEIRQVVDILTRRRQNNPILVGEAGVGKTAVVEGFALRIASGDVPEPLKKVQLHTLDLALLQAGAGIKGEFENRLKSLINEVKSSPIPDYSVHRRSSHHDRRGWRRRAGRCRQPLEARFGARRTAHRGCHHVVRIQEVLREGPRTGAPFPIGQSGRARRETVRADAPRACPGTREASQRAHPRRRPGSGGEVVQPLPSRPPVARQGRQRARHHLRAPGAWGRTPFRRPSKTLIGLSTISPCRPACWIAKSRWAPTTASA
jgi:hypothetical protein